MMINTNNMVSLTEANRNFSKVAKLVEETGSAIILQKYKHLSEFEAITQTAEWR